MNKKQEEKHHQETIKQLTKIVISKILKYLFNLRKEETEIKIFYRLQQILIEVMILNNGKEEKQFIKTKLI